MKKDARKNIREILFLICEIRNKKGTTKCSAFIKSVF